MAASRPARPTRRYPTPTRSSSPAANTHPHGAPAAAWRASRVGCEGRISHLKRRYGLRRARLRGEAGAETWVGWGILAYNLDTLALQAHCNPSRRAVRAG